MQAHGSPRMRRVLPVRGEMAGKRRGGRRKVRGAYLIQQQHAGPGALARGRQQQRQGHLGGGARGVGGSAKARQGAVHRGSLRAWHARAQPEAPHPGPTRPPRSPRSPRPAPPSTCPSTTHQRALPPRQLLQAAGPGCRARLRPSGAARRAARVRHGPEANEHAAATAAVTAVAAAAAANAAVAAGARAPASRACQWRARAGCQRPLISVQQEAAHGLKAPADGGLDARVRGQHLRGRGRCRVTTTVARPRAHRRAASRSLCCAPIRCAFVAPGSHQRGGHPAAARAAGPCSCRGRCAKGPKVTTHAPAAWP